MDLRRPSTLALLLLAASCGSVAQTSEDATAIPPKENWDRDIVSTKLDIDLANKTGTARIVLAPHTRRGASFEVDGLEIASVVDTAGKKVPHAVHDGQLDLGIAAKQQVEVTIAYSFTVQSKLEGWTKSGVTFLWPNFCGNLFPCKSDTSDGTKFTLDVHGQTKGTLVFPKRIDTDAPAYMVAWALGDYTKIDLGKTKAGTSVAVYHLPGGASAAKTGTEPLRDAFEWLETTYGKYRFGKEVASVAAHWGPGAFGGMEHHPYWHVSTDSMNDTETHVHEAVHGWFGDGVRIDCWEDLTLSEGTTTYLAARALEAVRGKAAGDAVWASYDERLDAVIASEDRIAWPTTCDEVDVINDFWNDVVYMKGAFFYRAVEAEVGRPALDAAIKSFYGEHVGSAAGVADMLETIQAETGFDPSDVAESWLRSEGRPDR